MSEEESLFDVRNAFYSGNYAGCIAEAQKLSSLPAAATLAKDAFMYRAYLALNKQSVVRSEIGDDAHPHLKPIKTLGQYLQNRKEGEKMADALEQELTSGHVDTSNPTWALVTATILHSENRSESALRALHACQAEDLELMALRLQILLAMDRVDLARKELKAMMDKDDDATITQLAQAWVNLQLGGEKLQDAYYIYQELIDKLGSTPLLLNGMASAFLMQGKYEEAEAALQEATDKDPNHADTLINLVVLSQLTGKPLEVCQRYVTQLKDEQADHPWVKSLLQKESDFDRMVAQYGKA